MNTKSEQGANTMTKLAEQKRLAHAVALTIESLDDYPSETVPVAESMIGSSEYYQTGGEVVNTDLHTPAPVFTQEDADAKKLPPIGAEAMVKSESLDDWYKGECIGFDNNEDGEFAVFAMSSNYPFPVRYAGFQARRIKPIDNRSDKEKLHDGLYGFVSGYVACGQQEDIDDYVRELLSKFTITLKE